MIISWNEIKERAIAFSKEWENESNEEAEAKPFLEAFLSVFGIARKKIGTFEYKVKKINERDGYIDLLWKGTLLIEMKSRGKNLEAAFLQAQEYAQGLKQYELPKFILVSDFENFHLYDLEESNIVKFTIRELVQNVHHFGFLIGYQKRIYQEQDPANIKAAELMGKLHDRIEEIGYKGHALEVYLVRILFCLFAEDTTIFNKQQFQDLIEQRTSDDGSDLAPKLQELFQVLNTPIEDRFQNLDEQLAEFPYVNGKLFEEILPMPSFDSKMRNALLQCCYTDWSKISPAIFGSMFQSVMNPQERRNLGAHYTSEKNILKLIKPLFLDELREEFDSVKGNRNKLLEFHKKLSRMKFLDPACGCGNFLVITYRELRLLEIDILRELNKSSQGFLDVRDIILLDVDMMVGLECEEFPARIAEVAMWLIDHQMNMLISNEFGQYYLRLPLRRAAKIVHVDSLAIDWREIVSPDELNFILGNPPFIGSKIMKQGQRDQIVKIFGNIKGSGSLDYVSGWYVKAAMFINGTRIKCAFVSTNSIVQGEQAPILWGVLFNKFGINIHFAHRTFKWSNEASGNAAVYCVIIGFAQIEAAKKVLYDYDDVRGEPHEIKATNINPYLIDGENIFIERRQRPLCNVPPMNFGNMPLDGGHFLLTDEERNELLARSPGCEKYIKPFISAFEFLNGKMRWCIWLKDTSPSDYMYLPEILSRVEAVRDFRLSSVREQTREMASYPYLFGEIRDFGENYIVLPRVSSENRTYIPIGFFESDAIVGDTCMAIPNASLFHFGILSSKMHMAWVKHVCGRLESRFRYSKDIVYNNFPFPSLTTDKQQLAVIDAASNVLNVRKAFPESSLAELYNPLTMPRLLVKAHSSLDRAVDSCYGRRKFDSDSQRMEFLIGLYKDYLGELFINAKSKASKRKRSID